MNNKKYQWGLCAATAIGMAFEAGLVGGENTPPEKMHGMSGGAPTALDRGEQFDGIQGQHAIAGTPLNPRRCGAVTQPQGTFWHRLCAQRHVDRECPG